MEKLTFKLEAFEGPLDLLLYLIAKHKINIADIPIAELLEQYLLHISQMDLDSTSEFLAMAASLVYIKSKMLLPKEEEEEDPREQLAHMLLEYQKYKQMTGYFQQGYEKGSKTFVKKPDIVEFDETYRKNHDPYELYAAYQTAIKRIQRKLPPPFTSFKGIVGKQIYSVNSKLVSILRNLIKKGKIKFSNLFASAKTRSEVVATFLAVLELSKINKIKIDTEKDDYDIEVVKTKG